MVLYFLLNEHDWIVSRRKVVFKSHENSRGKNSGNEFERIFFEKISLCGTHLFRHFLDDQDLFTLMSTQDAMSLLIANYDLKFFRLPPSSTFVD